MSWPRVALRTMPYPDIYLVGLGVEWASHHIGHISNICSKLKLPLIRRLKACMESKSSIHRRWRPKINAHVHPHFTVETASDVGATHCPSQPMILRPILVILLAPSQMEYTIRHMVAFNSKAYANI